MKKILFLFLFCSALSYGQGLIRSTPEERKSFPKYKIEDFGFADLLPFASSLEKYVPPILEQEGGTCVGFASFYYGLSTMYNAQFNITNKAEKFAHSFDPYFIYSYAFSDVYNCESGLDFKFGFETLKKLGIKKLFFPPMTECDTKWSEEQIDNIRPYTRPYSIQSWSYLDKNNFTEKEVIDAVKGKIYEKIPVICGFGTVKSIDSFSSDNLIGVKSDGLWDPRPYEEIDPQVGHALCVIGYNDNKFGGAFRIANSWGDEYGDKGFMWLKYDDFAEYADEIYILKLNNNLIELPPVVIDEKNYKRKDIKNNGSLFFEGQYYNDQMNGYGILSDNINKLYSIGNYNNGAKDGPFVTFFVDNDNEISYSLDNYYDDDKVDDEMGFGSDENNEENEQKTIRYLVKLDNKLNLRKSTSGRSSSSKRKK
jgi:hypothetical protein